ncbi:nuclear transport factor 2 family protein [Streptomyces palmae]|uniref:Nuclear transport factor 2 family protein n=1 Tax=Streptomyces palmae TaxID=1701085 RepID=A0A4Z0FL72_9ACTN|nr:nuclear transport factor 2 family protein [Streptomyces palmae]TGA83492.1 nuclear transport factor 2 family protein [Streptomyces palmae]
MRIRSAAAIATLLCLPLTACGGSDGDGDKPAASSPAGKADGAQDSAASGSAEKSDGDQATAALEQSVRDYTKALFTGDASGYALLSERCKKELTKEQFVTMGEQAHNDYGSLTVKNIKVDQISGDMARVSYGVGVPQFEQKAQSWTREAGTWRWDAC